MSWAALKRQVARLRRQGRTVAFTNGCFDILHAGHVSYLEAAKKKDRVLIVGLNSDASVKRIKGPKRPVVGQKERAKVLAALGCVDFVAVFTEDTPYKLIAAVQPDVLVKGADWKGRDIAGSDIVKKRGGRVELIRYLPSWSTTNIIEAVRQTCCD
ncbi:MAG: D-glycero-beta-D-manno-heptose 1-phosphate adenylyltransferase [Candidatus Omnitrophota bacterium]|nr:D-glycero-beta-D-manno-heptose 1-phosphate adenylyltransferase [Candidatus Omnitrophota bacterium]